MRAVKTWGGTAAVIAALRDDAAAEAERVERDADAALAALGTAAIAIPDAPDPAPRIAAARRAVAEAQADGDWQDAVDAAADRDAWIASIAQQGRRVLGAAERTDDWTAALAREAVRHLPGPACIVTVPSVSAAPDDAWRVALEAATGKQITLERGAFAAGCLARTPDGRVTFDNRLEAREDRLRTEWRAALARIYEAAVAAADVMEPGMIAPDRCAAAGRVIELLGPVVRARLVTPMALGDIGFIGEERLIGEIVAMAADVVTLEVYESTVGIAAGAPLFACGQPLSAELGPGLLGGIFDGLQRPLPRSRPSTATCCAAGGIRRPSTANAAGASNRRRGKGTRSRPAACWDRSRKRWPSRTGFSCRLAQPGVWSASPARASIGSRIRLPCCAPTAAARRR